MVADKSTSSPSASGMRSRKSGRCHVAVRSPSLTIKFLVFLALITATLAQSTSSISASIKVTNNVQFSSSSNNAKNVLELHDEPLQQLARRSLQSAGNSTTANDDTDDGLRSEAARAGVWLSVMAALAIIGGIYYYLNYGNPLDHIQAARQREAEKNDSQSGAVFSPLSSGNAAHDAL